MGIDSGFGAMPGIFTFVFVVILALFVIGIIGGISNYAKNASAPILTTRAKVVTKRTQVTHHDHMHTNGESDMPINHSTNSTRYFVTFETDAGQRMELTLSGKEYGLMVEGDSGELIYQGEWYKQFTRDI